MNRNDDSRDRETARMLSTEWMAQLNERWANHRREHDAEHHAFEREHRATEDYCRTALGATDQRFLEGIESLDRRFGESIEALDRRLNEQHNRYAEAAEVRHVAIEESARAALAAATASIEKWIAALDVQMKEIEARVRAEQAAGQVQTEKNLGMRIETLDRDVRETATRLRTETHIAFDSSEKAITKADIATEKRFASINEFRAQLSDQAVTFMPRTEAETRISQALEKIDDLTRRIDRGEGSDQGRTVARENAGQWYGWGVAAITIIIAVVILINTLTAHP